MDDFSEKFRQIQIGGRYHIICRLGSGSFGAVYQGMHILSSRKDVISNDDVAIKLEHHTIQPSLLREEVAVYSRVAKHGGFPTVSWTGFHDDFRVMIMELLGPNLEDLLQYCGGTFSLKTTLMIADQLLHRFEVLHKEGFLHRDVKPENFLMGVGRQGNIIYMVDFGLAIYRQTDETVYPILDTHVSNVLGTVRYASIRGNLGLGQSPRDDLEALGYMLVYFLRGRLPWQGVRAASRCEKHRLILEQKRSISTADLCHDLPPEFCTYMNYVRGLPNDEQPDYRRQRTIFRGLFRHYKYEYDNLYDWTIMQYMEQGQERLRMSESRPVKKAREKKPGCYDAGSRPKKRPAKNPTLDRDPSRSGS